MIFTALSWVYVIGLGFIYGLLADDLLSWIRRDRSSVRSPFSTRFVSGLALISCIISYLYIFIPIGLVANLFVASVAIIYAVIRRLEIARYCQSKIAQWLTFLRSHPVLAIGFFTIFAFFYGLLLFRSSIGVFYTDTSIYHLQYIEWATRYPAIPGLANFFHRLAFNSQWLLLNTLFSGLFLFNFPLLTLNTLILLVMLIASITNGLKLIQGEITILRVFNTLTFFPFTYFIFNSQVPTASSPSTDLPATIAVFIIFGLIIQYFDTENRGEDTDLITAQTNFLIGFALTVRITILPALLFTLYAAYRQWKKGKINQIFWGALPLVVVLIPWLITNIILSGYLLGPITQIDVFNVDWKVPKPIFAYEKEYLLAWVRGFPGQVEAMEKLGFLGWVPTWFQGFKTTAEYRYLVGSLVVAAIAIGIYQQSLIHHFKRYSLAFAIALIGITIWFFTAPEPRYAYGFIWGWVLLIATLVLFSVSAQLHQYQRVYKVGIGAIAACVLLLTVHHQIQTVTFYLEHHTKAAYSVFSLKGGIITGGETHPHPYPAYSFWVAPMKFPDYPVTAAEIDGIPVYGATVAGLCGRAFPCTPFLEYFKLPTVLKRRGESIRDGFKMVYPVGNKP
jgi:hypothetical protein